MPPYVGLLGESQDISSLQQETKHHLARTPSYRTPTYYFYFNKQTNYVHVLQKLSLFKKIKQYL